MKQSALGWLLAALTLLTACQSTNPQETAAETSQATQQGNTAGSELFTDRDMEVGYDAQTAAAIVLHGTQATCDSDAVTIDGTTITIADEGTYILSGTWEDGMVVVDAGDTDKVQLVLDGVSIHCSTSAPLYVRQADKVFVTLAQDSQNILTGGDTFEAIDENNIDGAIFAKSDLTLNGYGTLTIQSPGGHGVVCKDDLVITSGTYIITAASHGLSGKDSVRIADGTFTLTTGKDGIQSDNPEDSEKGYVYLKDGVYTVTAEGDGFSASSWMQVDGGTYEVTTGGGSVNGETHTQDTMGGGRPQPALEGDGQPPQRPEGMEPPEGQMPGVQPTALPTETAQVTEETAEDTPSTKGFKAGTALTIGDGTFTLDCADDGFHANGDVLYQKGTAQIQSGDDAFHADNALTIDDGTIAISTCYEGLEGLTVTVNGGDIQITASDDGVNAAGGTDQSGLGGRGQDAFGAQSGAAITITGGALTVTAEGDGLDSNGSLAISGGTIYVSTLEMGADTALDCDGSARITGGVVIATGAAGMVRNFGEESTQGSILLAVDSQSAGSTVSVTDSTGNVLASWTPSQSFTSVLVSCPGLEAGGSYTVTAGEATEELTLDSLQYGTEGGMGPGGMGGRPGMKPQTTE